MLVTFIIEGISHELIDRFDALGGVEMVYHFLLIITGLLSFGLCRLDTRFRI